MNKKCGLCGEIVESGQIECPKCGSGVFETEKIHREQQIVKEKMPSSYTSYSPKGDNVIKKILHRLLGRKPSASSKRPIEKDASTSVGKYREGDLVKCGRCGNELTVRYSAKAVASGTDAALASIALRCQSCGFITCHSCSTPGGSSIHGSIPICPSCGEEGGPYLFFEP